MSNLLNHPDAEIRNMALEDRVAELERALAEKDAKLADMLEQLVLVQSVYDQMVRARAKCCDSCAAIIETLQGDLGWVLRGEKAE